MAVWCSLVLPYVLVLPLALLPSLRGARLKHRAATAATAKLQKADASVDLTRAFIGLENRSSGLRLRYQTRRSSAPSETVQLPAEWQPYITNRRKVGNGAFGDVAKFQLQCPSQADITLAMKVIEKTNQNDEALNNEISALTEVTEYLNEHTDMQPYITSLLANPTVAGNSLFLVSPFFANGEFEDALAEWDEYGGFPAMYGFMLHVAKGVAAMHEAGWVHGDLKFANAMISCVGKSKAPRDCHAAVIDLGLACRTAEANCGRRGTPLYVAPEVLRRYGQEQPDPKTDVWSLGIMLYEMVFNINPVNDTDGNSIADVYRNIYNYDLANVRTITGLESEPVLNSLLTGMLTQSLSKRLTMQQVIQKLTQLAHPDMIAVAPSTAASVDCLQPDYIVPSKQQGTIGYKRYEPSLNKWRDVRTGRFTSAPPEAVHGKAPTPVRAEIGEAFQCCYSNALFTGSGSHYMAKAGTQCGSGLKGFSDYGSCNSLAGGSCNSCWDSCCKLRHSIMTSKYCTGSGAEDKREKQCLAAQR